MKTGEGGASFEETVTFPALMRPSRDVERLRMGIEGKGGRESVASLLLEERPSRSPVPVPAPVPAPVPVPAPAPAAAAAAAAAAVVVVVVAEDGEEEEEEADCDASQVPWRSPCCDDQGEKDPPSPSSFSADVEPVRELA
jgi:hypothetical protein